MPLGKRLARRSNVGTSLAREWPASQLPQQFSDCLRTLIAIDAVTKHISRQAKGGKPASSGSICAFRVCKISSALWKSVGPLSFEVIISFNTCLKTYELILLDLRRILNSRNPDASDINGINHRLDYFVQAFRETLCRHNSGENEPTHTGSVHVFSNSRNTLITGGVFTINSTVYPLDVGEHLSSPGSGVGDMYGLQQRLDRILSRIDRPSYLEIGSSSFNYLLETGMQTFQEARERLGGRIYQPLPPIQTSTDGYPKDNPLKDGRRTDIVILVMGPTGAGKSTYINYVLNKDGLQVGHRVNSSTTNICPVVIDPIPAIPGFPQLAGRRLILVDIPGFDDTFVDEVEILKRIAKWLAASYRKRMPIGGVLYLHDISLKRFTGFARRNLQMFRRLCGEDALKKVVFVTTSWQMDAPDDHERREEQLKSSHWKPMIDEGADVRRFLETGDSAWEILKIFLHRVDHQADIGRLLIQQEVVDRRLPVPDTEAGKALLLTLQETLSVHKTITELVEATAGGDPKARATLDEARARMRTLEEQIRSFKGSLPQRFLNWLRISVRDILDPFSLSKMLINGR